MQRNIKYIISVLLIVISTTVSFSQLDAVMKGCEKNLTKEYISDGQQYISLLTGDQIAEFNVIFYGGNTYRISACANNKQIISFTVFDKNRKEIFNSSEHNNIQFWDFQFKSTLECFIEVSLVSDKKDVSGFAVLLVGLKQ